MRLKKSLTNSFVNILMYFIVLFPDFIMRRLFIVNLGEDLLGLNSLYLNIISLLSIAELGIGSAIIFSLYKPFADNDKKKIKGYLDFYKYFYRKVGLIIFLGGIIVSIFLGNIINNEINIIDARLYFYLFLIKTLLGYLFSYKNCLLVVAQEGYKISIINSIAKLITCGFQIITLTIYKSFYLYLIIEICINSIYFIYINLYINKRFYWIKEVEGEITKEERVVLNKKVKAMFLHKIGSKLVTSTDNMIITKFISLSITGVFNSYNMVINSFKGIITIAISAITASIGNLLATSDEKKAYTIHKNLFFINFWVVSFVTISLYNTLNQFVLLWLGENIYIDNLTLIILLINFYFVLMRGSVERFKEGAGMYEQDKYAPLVEAIINLSASIILVNIIGLPGVFIGTLISNILVIFWIKPMIVYKYVFKIKVIEYFKMYFKYFGIAIIPLIITIIATNSLKKDNNLISFIINCLINIVVINSIYIIIFRKRNEYIYFKNIILNGIEKSKNKYRRKYSND